MYKRILYQIEVETGERAACHCEQETHTHTQQRSGGDPLSPMLPENDIVSDFCWKSSSSRTPPP